MGGKRGNKKKRTNRRATGPKKPRSAASLGQHTDLRKSGKTMTMEHGDITFMLTFTEAQENLADDTVSFSLVPTQDTIHPHPLNFPPPLEELSATKTAGFQRHWEKLTYVFNLPDPRDFPPLPLTDDDRKLLNRFVEQCRYLAGFSLLSDNGGISWSSGPEGTQIKADLPSGEAFVGTVAAFRQIHNHGEDASFSKVKGRLFNATGQINDEDAQNELRAVMSRWVDARGDLMNRLLPTIVCQKVSNAPPGHPISYRDIKPEELFLAFNYGDTIHWGEQKEKLADLLDTPDNKAYYQNALCAAILGLSHLYFGWSLLVQAALGDLNTV